MKRIICICSMAVFFCISTGYASDYSSLDFAWNLDPSTYPYNPPTDPNNPFNPINPLNDTISWMIDQSDLTAQLNSTDITTALSAAFNTWDNPITADYDLVQIADDGGAHDPVDSLNWDFLSVDIVIGGWLDAATWANIGADPNNIAGTFPFTFRDDSNNRVDWNGDGRFDLVQQVIFFNDSKSWATDGSAGAYDLQSVATHEIGHALGLHHSPAGVDSVMDAFNQPGLIRHDLTAYDLDQIGTIYPLAQPVPEPSAIALFIFGGLALLRKKSKKLFYTAGIEQSNAIAKK